ncbi:FP25K [Operophtera brumata nucleopolyhedrovirus]|uniref:FP25K n=1 Tax=Operophtera brumata nucleopolyhedrovirus TaxID=1046267 RepID=A0A2H4UZU7_9ABAC|nr:FP25K [Operophtera brumata nucleopolyhedrovirus]AUA60285.1 FP25K [Operophtera brumata nucleopolyhedrovirus]
METETSSLINFPYLKNIIKNEINRNDVTDISDIKTKLKKLENDQLNDCAEVYGIYDNRLHNKKIRQNYIKKICTKLDLDYKHVVDTEYENNHILVKLANGATAKEWQSKSRERRIKNLDIGLDYDGPIKIFVAATAEQKLLLKKSRDALLPYFKFVSMCKKGVMARKEAKSKIHIIKNEIDIAELLHREQDDIIKTNHCIREKCDIL